jgi:integrase/recombinase XerD
MQAVPPRLARAPSSDEATIRTPFVAFLRTRGYAEATIRLHKQRLDYFFKRVARSGRHLSDLTSGELLALLRRSRPVERASSRRFIRIWMRYRNPARREQVRPWQPWVDDYLDFRANHQAICQSTLAKETRVVRRFLTWQFGKQPCDWAKVRVQDIWRYCDESSCDYKASVANHRLGWLRGFLRFVHLRGQCPITLSSAVSFRASYGFDERTPKILSDDQRRLFLKSFDCSHSEGARDYAMALCMVDLGLRVGEVVLLKLADVDWGRSSLTVPGIKSHGARTLPLVSRLREALRNYAKRFRPASDSDRLFVRHPRFRGAPLDVNAASHAMRCAYRRCGFPGSWSGAHRLRHTFASRLYSSGAPVKEIADLLGHRDLNSTHRYTQVDFEGLRQVAQPWPI